MDVGSTSASLWGKITDWSTEDGWPRQKSFCDDIIPIISALSGWDSSGGCCVSLQNAPLRSARGTTLSFGLFSQQRLEETSGFSHL
ncbi:hypothetical protein D5086_016898 [Populus alba]|uniref:Uncharacterized protein n=1 Tax=Populus alba TaxID=43335 RepID=A0ACC4BVY2_POPAL